MLRSFLLGNYMRNYTNLPQPRLSWFYPHGYAVFTNADPPPKSPASGRGLSPPVVEKEEFHTLCKIVYNYLLLRPILKKHNEGYLRYMLKNFQISTAVSKSFAA